MSLNDFIEKRLLRTDRIRIITTTGRPLYDGTKFDVPEPLIKKYSEFHHAVITEDDDVIIHVYEKEE